MKLWLKILCAVLLFYALLSSFYHPLAPGGLTVDIEKLVPGANTFVYSGYNTHFKDHSNDGLQFFVSSGSHYYPTEIIEVIDNNHAKVNVVLPDTLPSEEIAFYANTPTDGTVYIMKPMDISAFVFHQNYTNGSVPVKVANDQHQNFGYPFQVIIFESIRNLMWHVPMWFTMFVIMFISFIQSIHVLSATGRENMLDSSMIYVQSGIHDRKASASAETGLIFCILGLITGSIWARFTWGAWWTNDPQLNGAMVVFLMYVAYFILRNSVNDEEKRARLAAIFNIFAFVLLVVLLMVMPRFAEGLHPGKSGNPAFSSYDLDSSLRMVFYPAVFGFILLGYWIYNLRLRIKILESNEEI